jgi:arylsulfatase A-like enzyme/Flp pilus assembly protein TadD
MRVFLILVLVATAFARELESIKTSQPDVFLITIDTLRADHVHCYGYDRVETPALDSLADEGARFSAAFTPSPITNTSHTSILTGLLPSNHGVTDFAVPLAASHATWAELLKERGYHTAAFIGAVILDSKTLAPGLDRGFDFYDNFPEHPTTKARWGRVERRGMEVVQHAEKWMTTHRADPHFLWLHLYDPHDPYEPPAPYSQTYKDHLYDGEIAYADSALGNFISYLKQQGRYENSLIVVVGDHGEGLGEHNEDTHGIFLYDSTTHVPLIIKKPGKQAHTAAERVVDAQVRTTDILPTVLDLLVIPTESQFDGKSLKPYLTGVDSVPRVAFGETDYPLRFGWAPLRSVRDDGFKFIQAPRPELYDLHTDPKELNNIYRASNTQVQKLRSELNDLKAEELPSVSPTATPGSQQDLKALGYVVGTQNGNGNSESLPDPKDKIQEQNLLHSAMMASDDNRIADARTALEKVLQVDPKSPTALSQLGEIELHSADYLKAAEYLGRAREVRPNDSAAAYYQGQALEKNGNFAGARDALEASLRLTPGQLPARLLLGNVYLSLKDPKAAEDQFEAALLLQPKSVEAKVGLSKSLLASKSYADALRELEPLSRSQLNNSEVFQLLFEAYSGLGKKDDAERARNRARLLAGKKGAS